MRRQWVIVWAVVASPLVLALDPTKMLTQYAHRQFGLSDGLPQNTVESIWQTQDDFIWLGTQDGLVRFDGQQMVVYNSLTRSDIKENLINALSEDGAGNLIVGTGGGAYGFDGKAFFALDASRSAQ